MAMATVRIPGGERGVRLAELIVQHNPGARWREVEGAVEVSGGRLVVERWMVEAAYWPDTTPDAHSARRFLRHLVLADQKAVQERSADTLVVADEEEAEQALLVRFPASVKERLARTADRLGLSQNELVIRAVEDLLGFVEEFGEA